jgi:hypothetical protein
MSTSSVEATIAAIGYAKVIVALKEVPSFAAASAMQAEGSIERARARKTEPPSRLILSQTSAGNC